MYPCSFVCTSSIVLFNYTHLECFVLLFYSPSDEVKVFSCTCCSPARYVIWAVWAVFLLSLLLYQYESYSHDILVGYPYPSTPTHVSWACGFFTPTTLVGTLRVDGSILVRKMLLTTLAAVVAMAVVMVVVVATATVMTAVAAAGVKRQQSTSRRAMKNITGSIMFCDSSAHQAVDQNTCKWFVLAHKETKDGPLKVIMPTE